MFIGLVRPNHANCPEKTYAHCSMLARACNMTARFLRLETFEGSTVFLENASTRGGITGGCGGFEAL